MIKPSIGRVVLVHIPGNEQYIPALICYVHNDKLINVGGFDQNGKPVAFTSIELRQGEEGDAIYPYLHGDEPYACWMPYQRKQAEIAEQASQR